MISTTKVLCFVAIAFADSDFQTDHDAVMRELSGGEPEGLDTIEEFRELVGDTDEFRELADAIADEDAEERETGLAQVAKKIAKKIRKRRQSHKHRQLDEDAEERETGLARIGAKVAKKGAKVAKKIAKRVRKLRQSHKHRQLDGDNAPVLV